MLEDTMQADLLERASWASALPRSAPVGMTTSPLTAHHRANM
jgi:hypothetical protein